MTSVAISIIVPVYNVERYLGHCLSSLVNQTLKNIEIIVVNDGSPDNSQQIIDKYASEHPNKIKAYIKLNGGLGDARNFGIEKATGEYVTFVDSDDWLELNACDLLYVFAKENQHDFVVFDKYTYIEATGEKHISLGYYAEAEFNHKNAAINSIRPAHACNKLISRELMRDFRFQSIWYEDIGLIPAVLSYSQNIGYLKKPLYYYRQNSGSITYQDKSQRNLEIINAWSKVIQLTSPDFREEIAYAVYMSVAEFLIFRPRFAAAYVEFVQANAELFEENEYIQKAIRDEILPNLFEMPIIPKKIHYFWFGRGNKPAIFEKCIVSWEKFAPGYEIIEWSEDNCDLDVNEYVKQAYQAKKYAFVSDYFRLHVLYEHGGFYVDTDTEFNDYIEQLRLNHAVFPFETRDYVCAGIIASIPNCSVINALMDTYKNDFFVNADGSFRTNNTVPKRITSLLKSDYGLDTNGTTQKLKDSVKVYSANYLIIDVYDGKNIAVHHYDASWWDVKDEVSYKHIVLQDYFANSENYIAYSPQKMNSRCKRLLYYILFDRETLKNKLSIKLYNRPILYKFCKKALNILP